MSGYVRVRFVSSEQDYAQSVALSLSGVYNRMSAALPMPRRRLLALKTASRGVGRVCAAYQRMQPEV